MHNCYKQQIYSCILLIRLWFQNVSPSSMVVPTGGRRTAAGQSGAVTSATHLRGIPAPSPIPATGSVPQHNHSLLQGQPGEIQPPLIICILLIKNICAQLRLWQIVRFGTRDKSFGLFPAQIGAVT